MIKIKRDHPALILLFIILSAVLSSCSGRETVPEESPGVWHSVTLLEYDGAVVRDIYLLDPLAGGGMAAVYYDMASEDYVCDLFSENDEYLGTVRPSESSGCPKAREIFPISAEVLLLADRTSGIWKVDIGDMNGCRAEKILSDITPTSITHIYGNPVYGSGGLIRFADDGMTAISVDGEAEELYNVYDGEQNLYVKIRSANGRVSVRPFTENGLGGEIRLPNVQYTDLMPAPGHELYLRDRTGLFYSDGGRAERLLDFVSAGISPSFVSGWAVKDENTVYVAESDYYREGDVCRLSVVRRGEADETESVPVIRVGCIGLSSDLNIAAAELLREGTARAEIADYSGKADPQKELRGDILSGRAPDVILLDRVESRDDFIRSGLFADLAPYLEASGDEDLSESVGPFMTDGKLYELPSEISVGFLAAGGGYQIGRSTDDFIDFCMSFVEDGKRPLPETDPESLLALMLKTSIPDFIQSGFDSPSFARLLEFCREYPTLRFPEDAVCAMREYSLYGYEGLLRMNAAVGGDAVILGYPSVSGSGIVLNSSSSLAICAGSERGDECWRLMLLFREAVRSRTNEERSLPFAVSEGEKAKILELAEKLEYFFYHNGGEASAFLEDDGSCWLDKLTDAEGVRSKVTPEVIGVCSALLNSAARSDADSAAMTRIIEEEASYYFSGAKTLEDTMSVIASRTGIYLAEKELG